MPGFGNSDVPAHEMAIEDYGRVLLEAMHNLGIDHFTVLGHHTGAWVALWMAANAPERIARVVPWGIAIFDAEYREYLSAEPPPQFSEDGSDVAAWWQTRRRMGSETYRPEVVIRSGIEMLQTGFRRFWGHHAAGRLDLGALLPTVQQPTLVICGERDRLWPQCEAAASEIPHARFHAFHGASMDVADEYPEELATVVADFMKEER
jgi:pimeloyl-ACP methyl ester carboxylesterase